MAGQRTRQNALTSPRKQRLFQCTGYGDCRMVFTRSEHLSRHARKHTGEKPFNCIVPECSKMFSRFDNMMQHTQTHRGTTSSFSADQRMESSGFRASTPSAGTDSIQTRRQQEQRRRRRRRRRSGSNTSTRSISSSSEDDSSCDDEQEEKDFMHRRRLSVAELCNPSIHHPQQHKVQLTMDEIEALQGFGFLQRTATATTSEFFDSLHDLIVTVGAGTHNNAGAGQGGLRTGATCTGNNASCVCL